MSRWFDRAARRIDKAQRLLEPAIVGAGGVWADLGCGEGVFTMLLTTLLPPDSVIYAVDRNPAALQVLEGTLIERQGEITVHTRLADFTQPLELPPLDGLLLANSLHFVNPKQPVMARLVEQLKPGGRLIIIEYNTNRGNSAVPYPLADRDFLTLAAEVGLQAPQLVARQPSTFLGEMYTGLAFAPVSGHR
ncbi:MAG TPA: methyltransferase domain-containing protein [Anaerolineae bacterium]|nr:methyltransferase domain-containing protein [Anaerolineae bacterium]